MPATKRFAGMACSYKFQLRYKIIGSSPSRLAGQFEHALFGLRMIEPRVVLLLIQS